jgi:anti-sigma factor RsiW
MRCDEAQELITAFIDGELTAGERLVLEPHLQVCEPCRQACAAESHLKQHIKLAARDVTAPAMLRDAIERGFAGRRSMFRAVAGERIRGWLGVSGWRPVFALTVLLVALATLMYAPWPEQSIGFAALETHASILNRKTALVAAQNPAALREELARAAGHRFTPVTLDLSAMKLYPVAGFVRRIGGRDVLVTVYQGGGPTVTCFTFLGSEADAPSSAERFYDAAMQLNFYSFSVTGLSGVLHREAGVICVVTSKMPAADLLAMIRGKSPHT